MSSSAVLAPRRSASRPLTPQQTRDVVELYPLCLSVADRRLLAGRLNISLPLLYERASRLGATGNGNRMAARPSPSCSAPSTAAFAPFSDEEDAYLRRSFGRHPLTLLAAFLQRRESEVALQARRLGLRGVPHFYAADSVAGWLGLPRPMLDELGRCGYLAVYACTDRRGVPTIELVSTSSLLRLLERNANADRLLASGVADACFLTDLLESAQALRDGQAAWEPNAWVSHGHTSLNPQCPNVLGLPFDGHDTAMLGTDLWPWQVSVAAGWAHDEWPPVEQQPHPADRPR